MKSILGILLIGILAIGCQNKKSEKDIEEQQVEFNQELVDELGRMVVVDQIAAYIRQGEYEKMSDEEWQAFKDSVFTTHQRRLKEMFDEHGYLGFDIVGEEGSSDFWVMVQHSDHNTDFQNEVLEKMKIEVEKGNAHGSNYAYLVDRVNLNTGKPQVYGTQVDYNFDIAKAFPRTLADSSSVNDRRKSIGMEPLEEYLNMMTSSNFEMNKEFYAKKGITEPRLYKIVD